jgi:hypothetical protein
MKQKLMLVLITSLILGGCTVRPKNKVTMVVPTMEIEKPAEKLVGNDEDKYGCKASAGYSWCEIKQKCLRVWEEKCEEKKVEETVKEAVTKILIEKYNLVKNKVSVQVDKEISGFASGSVGFGEEIGGGGWLARKLKGKWEVVWDGNTSVDCPKMRTEYKFPDEILKPGFCD